MKLDWLQRSVASELSTRAEGKIESLKRGSHAESSQQAGPFDAAHSAQWKRMESLDQHYLAIPGHDTTVEPELKRSKPTVPRHQPAVADVTKKMRRLRIRNTSHHGGSQVRDTKLTRQIPLEPPRLSQSNGGPATKIQSGTASSVFERLYRSK